MRKAVRARFPYFVVEDGIGYAQSELVKWNTLYDCRAEEQLRTYLLAGVDPDELATCGSQEPKP